MDTACSHKTALSSLNKEAALSQVCCSWMRGQIKPNQNTSICFMHFQWNSGSCNRMSLYPQWHLSTWVSCIYFVHRPDGAKHSHISFTSELGITAGAPTPPVVPTLQALLTPLSPVHRWPHPEVCSVDLCIDQLCVELNNCVFSCLCQCEFSHNAAYISWVCAFSLFLFTVL